MAGSIRRNTPARRAAGCALLAVAMAGPGPLWAFEALDAVRALAPQQAPQDPADGASVTDVRTVVDGWQVEARFAWDHGHGQPGWRLLGSRVTPDAAPAVADPASALVATGNTNPPHQPPPGGNGRVSSTFWSEGWTVDVVYDWQADAATGGAWRVTRVALAPQPVRPSVPVQ